MNPNAVQQAEVRLRKAKASLEQMNKPITFAEFESLWSDFLLAANSVYSKLEQGAKASGSSNAWFGRVKRRRRTEPLLTYLHHARNSDEHGIEPVSKFEPFGIGINGLDGKLHIKSLEIENGKVKLDPGDDPVDITLLPPRAVLVPVHDTRFNDTFYPPTEYQGMPLPPDVTPQIIAALAISALEDIVREAKELPSVGP